MLTSTLSVAPVDEGFEFSLTVRNDDDEPVELSFRSGQRVDFVVERVDDADGTGDGQEVWRYSDGRLFTQALGRETLEPGESLSYGAIWEDPPAGEYEVRGVLTAENVDAEASMVVSVPPV
ncbi:hypothetical protein AArcSl_3008 [Halalkaliarchaeum desulfuricum]|uniref:Intracellular proteinase inhibitor BsuPI domain-containing protein n=1 Tax=Halalkaliarchaeum desulfuricum TaxID=2055893 RepID=A0A343TNE7_9EURY|nr:BsuPI-related putative proteinase inhibitor [Halalkaliarchaeum desulfuricum]AUX10619.1 hypothetical protein AArcSl_3008 [Halalkaliarchaeum desulfuricum]